MLLLMKLIRIDPSIMYDNYAILKPSIYLVLFYLPIFLITIRHPIFIERYLVQYVSHWFHNIAYKYFWGKNNNLEYYKIKPLKNLFEYLTDQSIGYAYIFFITTFATIELVFYLLFTFDSFGNLLIIFGIVNFILTGLFTLLVLMQAINFTYHRYYLKELIFQNIKHNSNDEYLKAHLIFGHFKNHQKYFKSIVYTDKIINKTILSLGNLSKFKKTNIEEKTFRRYSKIYNDQDNKFLLKFEPFIIESSKKTNTIINSQITIESSNLLIDNHSSKLSYYKLCQTLEYNNNDSVNTIPFLDDVFFKIIQPDLEILDEFHVVKTEVKLVQMNYIFLYLITTISDDQAFLIIAPTVWDYSKNFFTSSGNGLYMIEGELSNFNANLPVILTEIINEVYNGIPLQQH